MANVNEMKILITADYQSNSAIKIMQFFFGKL